MVGGGGGGLLGASGKRVNARGLKLIFLPTYVLLGEASSCCTLVIYNTHTFRFKL